MSKKTGKEETAKRRVGRPTAYTEENIAKAQAYIDGDWEKADDAIPSVAGLAVFLGLTRETIHAWGRDEEKGKFSDMLGQMLAKQEKILLSRGLRNEHNSMITKLVLSKHGYTDRLETENKHDVSDPMKELLEHVANKGARIGD